MLESLKSSATSFTRNEDGAIAIIFGLSLVVVLGMITLSVDAGRAMSAQAKADAALDAAALAATRALTTSNMTDAEVEQYARDFFTSNAQGSSNAGDAEFRNLVVQIDRRSKTIRLSVNTNVPTTFGRVLGISELNFDSDTVATFNVNDIELSMALDVTGSMGGTKIADLRVAASNLVDTLIPDTGSISQVRIALAPYSASVNVGSLADAATDSLSADGCVIERQGREAYTDAPPARNAFFDAGPAMDIDPFEGRPGSAYVCPSSEVVPLTDNKTTLKTAISGYRANGYTAGHLGAAWAWYMVSEHWAGVVPAGSEPGAYGKKNLIKAVVLMTDGVFNTSYRNGSSRNQALDQCDAMKAEGVIVYSVSFKSPNHPTLTDCASVDPETGTRYYYEADNGTELNEAFQDIAVRLSGLRLAQ